MTENLGKVHSLPSFDVCLWFLRVGIYQTVRMGQMGWGWVLGIQSGKSGRAGKSSTQVIRTRGLEVLGPQLSTTINSWGELEHIIPGVQCHHFHERVGLEGGRGGCHPTMACGANEPTGCYCKCSCTGTQDGHLVRWCLWLLSYWKGRDLMTAKPKTFTICLFNPGLKDFCSSCSKLCKCSAS